MQIKLNWGLQNTGIDTEWSMRMDADEEIMEDLAAEIDEKLPQVKAPVNGVILRAESLFYGQVDQAWWSIPGTVAAHLPDG